MFNCITNGGAQLSDEEEQSADDKKGASTLITLGSEISASAVSGALGFLAGGPVLAGAAAAGGIVLAKVLVAIGQEVSERILSPREKMRVGAALAEAANTAKERLASGATLRDDDYVDDGTKHPPVNEITEGLLMVAQRAYQEKKVPFVGRLAANLNFEKAFDVTAARWLTHLADRLSYTQLCLLRLAEFRTTNSLHIPGKIENKQTKGPAHAALISELLELHSLGLINFGDTAVIGLLDVDPAKMKLQGFGVHLFRLMGLQHIAIEDTEYVLKKLSGS